MSNYIWFHMKWIHGTIVEVELIFDNLVIYMYECMKNFLIYHIRKLKSTHEVERNILDTDFSIYIE